MRLLLLGAGVVGNVYCGKLQAAGHHVVVLARGERLVEIQTHGLRVRAAESGRHIVEHVTAVREVAPDDRFEVVLVCVRRVQLIGTLPSLTGMADRTVNDAPPEIPRVIILNRCAGVLGVRFGGSADQSRVVLPTRAGGCHF